MSSPAKLCPLCGTRFESEAVFCQRDGARLTPEGAKDPFLGREILGQFRIDEAIGAGGMGTVYRARQTTLGRDVAIKILHPELTNNSDAARRFQREAKVATSLEHPNLVRVFLFGELPDQGHNLYLVMEYLDGYSLGELLEKQAPLPLPRALHIATQICDAVGAAHDQGIVHRDVKPENVMVVQRRGDPDFVKVLDFGIARLLWDEQSAMTQSGVIFGTARYISPEGAAGEATDARSDVYGIGVLIYQLLTGRTPFDASTPVSMLMKHIHETPPALRSVGTGAQAPQAIEDIVMRSLAKNPDARYPNANAFCEALRQASADGGLQLPAAATWGNRESRGEVSGAFITEEPERSRPVSEKPSSRPAETTEETWNVWDDHDGSAAPMSLAPSLPTRRGPMLLGAMLFVGLLIAGGVFGYGSWQQAERTARWEERLQSATAALEAERYVADESGVAVLTARLLEDIPDGEAEDLREQTQELRERAIGQLREKLVGEKRDEDFEAAIATVQKLLVFLPGDNALEGELSALRTAQQTPEEPAGLRLHPAAPRVGEAVSLVGVAEGSDQGARFEIFRGTRRLRTLAATQGGDERHFVASHVFRRAGRYRVVFIVGEASYETPVMLRTGPRRSPAPGPRTTQTRSPEPAPTPVQETQETPSENAVNDDNVDWGLPPEPPQQATAQTPSAPETAPAPAPPAPWTGQ